MRTFTVKVVEATENSLSYDIISDGFRKIEMLGILSECHRIVIEREKQKETATENEKR